MGIKLFISTIKLIQQRQGKTLQLGKCVVKDVNFHLNKCSYGYKTIQFHNKGNTTKAKKYITTSNVCCKDDNHHENKCSYGYETFQCHN